MEERPLQFLLTKMNFKWWFVLWSWLGAINLQKWVAKMVTINWQLACSGCEYLNASYCFSLLVRCTTINILDSEQEGRDHTAWTWTTLICVLLRKPRSTLFRVISPLTGSSSLLKLSFIQQSLGYKKYAWCISVMISFLTSSIYSSQQRHRSWNLVKSSAASFCALDFIGGVRFVKKIPFCCRLTSFK